MKNNNWWNRSITWWNFIKVGIFVVLAILAFYAWMLGWIDVIVTSMRRTRNKFINRNSTVHDIEEGG